MSGDDHRDNDLEHGSASGNVFFRDLRRADLPELMELQSQLFPVQYNRNFYDKLFMYGHHCIVGVDSSGTVVAVASARVIEYEKSGARLPQVQGYIMTLGVRQSHRRLRLGSRVLDEICKLLRTRTAAEVVMLHVKGANTAAVAFYESHGFLPDGPNGGLLAEHYELEGRMWDAYQYLRPLAIPFIPRMRERLEGCAIL